MESPSSWRRFFSELKRRNVYKVAVAYLAVSFIGLQAVDLLVPATTLPAWADELLIALAIFGFPIALVLAWAFEVTPQGVRRTSGVDLDPKAAGATGWTGRWYRHPVTALVGLVLLAAAGGWFIVGTGDGPDVTDRSIAVLPFTNMGSEESAQFTRGMHDGLLTRLAGISDLRVISRTSVMAYEDTDLTIPEIARELGVAWVVEGGIQQVGDQLQVNAQLIRGPEDVHQWAESFRRELSTENLFDIQSELTKRIARSLEAQLSTDEQERVGRLPTGDLEAYQLYVQGRAHLDGRTEEGIRRGLTLFDRAIARDPAYGLAWSGLADAKWLLAFYGHGSADTLYAQALDAAHRALRIDSTLAEAHASLGALYRNFLGDGPAALRELQRAVQLRPSYARAYHWLSGVETTLGRPHQGLEHLRTAVELDPRSPPIHVSLAWAYWLTQGAGKRALDHARQAVELEPGLGGAHTMLGLILSGAGRVEEAITQYRRGLEREPVGSTDWALSLGGLGVAHALGGDTIRAREQLDRLGPGERVSFYRAMIYVALGEETAAFRALRSTEWRSVEAFGLLLPIFDRLREDPRFEDLSRHVNRYWGLDPDGSLPEEPSRR